MARQTVERRIDGRALRRVRTFAQGRGALMDAEPGEKFALRHRAMNRRARSPCRPGKVAKINMRGEIGAAGIGQRIGETMPLHRLQGFAAWGSIVAIVDGEERAALRGETRRKTRHHLHGRKTCLQHLARLARHRKARLRAGRKSKAKLPGAIEADEPFMPAILAANEMADRQTIEELIGDDDRGARGQILDARVPFWGRPRGGQRGPLAPPQDLARLDEMEIDGRGKIRRDFRRAQSIRHQTAAPRPQLDQKERPRGAHAAPDRDTPKADQFAKHLADLGRGDEITALARAAYSRL